MKRLAVIGGGVSGLACARLLSDRYAVRVFEKERCPGGLIRCERVSGSLFHICGGHVFNTKNAEVDAWFWSRFDKSVDFTKADRKSAVCLENEKFVDYPIENHVYQLDADIQRKFFAEVDEMIRKPPPPPGNFGEFLLRVPGCFWHLGVRGEDPASAEPLHSPRFAPDESAIVPVIALHAATAIAYLERE